MNYRCFFCLSRAFEKLIIKEKLSNEQANLFTKEIIQLYSEKGDSYLTPQFAGAIYANLKRYTGNNDPFSQVKRQSNDLVLGMYDNLKEKVEKANNPFDMALRLAIAGNIIDFAVNDKYNLQETINHVLNTDFSINHSEDLQNELKQADTVLYLGDNNGEIVLDKLLIETINHPNLIFAVRGEPVINDITIKDAEYVGMKKIVPIVSNGTNLPSTVLSECSDEFKEIFNKADLVISKGQGNLEGLQNESNHNIFFLLMVKCDVIAESIKVKKGDFVVKMNKSTHENSNSKWQRRNWKDSRFHKSF